ncbi:MAG: sulfide/dihydroorotate dehydrogenase-like FAD/NAD-binding protein [Spirochaetaceae bacterium]|jgi:ferredoxin--NADP+ reductase|nr:sulfide/dihydroorotate dehydrogenase-like FAD/NAD-binding protein [Spirochaetaceae bacterium]
MNTILAKKQLSADVYEMLIQAPLIAQSRQAGQFLLLSLDNEYAERIPLTIADADPDAGTVTIVFQVAGATTHKLARKNAGQYLENVLGPLGNPTHIKHFGSVVCVGGGIGAAPLFPIVQAMKSAGNRVTVIIGARNRDLIIFEERIRRFADEFIIVTDDGSVGRKALVTEPLKEICAAVDKPDMTVAIGPPLMMKFCVSVAKEYTVPIMVSLNTIMLDGTGMCGCCRVKIGNDTRFVCVDGPEFDGCQVDFDSMMNRMKTYRNHEQAVYHRCKLTG